MDDIQISEEQYVFNVIDIIKRATNHYPSLSFSLAGYGVNQFRDNRRRVILIEVKDHKGNKQKFPIRPECEWKHVNQFINDKILNISAEEDKQYSNALLLLKLCNKTYPAIDITMAWSKEKLLFQLYVMRTEDIALVIPINEFMNWKNVNSYILRNVVNQDTTCQICQEDCKYNDIGCSKCLNTLCKACYVSILKTNSGIYKCPFCRFEYGQIMDSDILDLYIDHLLKQSNIQ